jgi:hypothetical protein
MPTFLSILNKLWQILKVIICCTLDIVIFCLSKLKDLLEQNDRQTAKPEYITRQELFCWLDEYFSKKLSENQASKHTGNTEKQNADIDKDMAKQGFNINSDFDNIFN